MEDIDLTLFLGGTRSGKSALAEALVSAKARGPVWYLATARPLGDDPAMAERIRRHRSRRPAHWHTLECPRHPGRELAPLLAAQAADAPVPTILLDCVTLWMSNILFALDDPQDAAAFETSLTEEVDELLHVMRAFPCRWVRSWRHTGGTSGPCFRRWPGSGQPDAGRTGTGGLPCGGRTLPAAGKAGILSPALPGACSRRAQCRSRSVRQSRRRALPSTGRARLFVSMLPATGKHAVFCFQGTQGA